MQSEVESEELDVVQVVENEPWLFWPTIGFSAAIGTIGILSQVVITVVLVIVSMVASSGDTEFLQQGNYLMGATLFSYPFLFGSMLLFIKLKKQYTCAEYLGWFGWRKMKWREFAPWFGILLGLMALLSLVSGIMQRDTSEFMLTLFQTANTPLLIFVLVIGAPLVEELFFRGFMFKGLERSKVGAVGAIVFTTIIWVAIHGFQYDWFELLYLMAFGVILGMARLKTGSICLPISLHVINNLIAVIPSLFIIKLGLQ